MKWLALLLAMALPAQAQELPLPALFDVMGVAADDALNVRAAPRGTAQIVGEFRHDATGVEIVRLSESGDWGLVNVGEGAGWTSMRFLSRQPGQDWDTPPALTACYGAEPFWSLSLGTDLGFRTPDEQVSIDPPEFVRTAGRSDPWALIGLTEHGAIHGIVSRQSCSDGMSDREEGFRIDLIYANQGVYTGCCTLSQ